LAIKISECNISEIEIREYNDDIKSLVKKILSKDPSARPTAKEILNNNSLFSSRKESFSARIDQLNLNSKKNRFMTTNSESNILISTQTANINQVNNLSNTFSTLNVQSPRITSKLCEVWSWGGGRITPKQIEYFNKYNAPLHVIYLILDS
jgi:serine/threonine protein kinase